MLQLMQQGVSRSKAAWRVTLNGGPASNLLPQNESEALGACFEIQKIPNILITPITQPQLTPNVGPPDSLLRSKKKWRRPHKKTRFSHEMSFSYLQPFITKEQITKFSTKSPASWHFM